MAFIRANLYMIGPQAAPVRNWRYDTLDPLATVDTAGYFNAAAGELRIGDSLHVGVWTTAVYTGTISAAGIMHVNANAAGVVDCADATALNIATDTD